MAAAIHAQRWLMTAPKAPLVLEAFDAAPAPGEVAVSVAGCGVCHTDLGYYYDGVRTNHPLPLALGHEVSGRVVAAGAGAEGWLGKAVIVPAVLPCGECDLCKRGLGTICRKQKMPGNDIQGGFASHILVPARGLCEVDERRLAAAGLELGEVSVVADALTTPYQAVRRAGVAPGALAVVIGAGGVGGYCVQVASAFGAKVIAVDVDDVKLAAMRPYGAALTLNATTMAHKALKAAITDFAKQNALRSTEWFILEYGVGAAGARRDAQRGRLHHGQSGAAAVQSDGVRCARDRQLGLPAGSIPGGAAARARGQGEGQAVRGAAAAQGH
jgi:6-hydroxycyclohex-1-ene-1-carbonyl-CoA dehydrogenase